MEKFLSALVQGISSGGVFALLAVGLVLAHKTSGVFNLALGAQAFASGAMAHHDALAPPPVAKAKRAGEPREPV